MLISIMILANLLSYVSDGWTAQTHVRKDFRSNPAFIVVNVAPPIHEAIEAKTKTECRQLSQIETCREKISRTVYRDLTVYSDEKLTVPFAVLRFFFDQVEVKPQGASIWKPFRPDFQPKDGSDIYFWASGLVGDIVHLPASAFSKPVWFDYGKFVGEKPEPLLVFSKNPGDYLLVHDEVSQFVTPTEIKNGMAYFELIPQTDEDMAAKPRKVIPVPVKDLTMDNAKYRLIPQLD